MKVEFKKVHCVCAWTWDIHQTVEDIAMDESGRLESESNGEPHTDEPAIVHGTIDDKEDEENVCGICRVSYDGTCPECVRDGQDCFLVVGCCHHVFHSHCIIKWLEQKASKGLCPMCRQPFTLQKDLTINQSQIEYFDALARQVALRAAHAEAGEDDFE